MPNVIRSYRNSFVPATERELPATPKTPVYPELDAHALRVYVGENAVPVNHHLHWEDAENGRQEQPELNGPSMEVPNDLPMLCFTDAFGYPSDVVER